MPTWLNKASLEHLPLLEPIKQDVTLSSSELTMLTFASTRGATVQFLILMLPWHNSRLRGLDLHSHLHLQPCMFRLIFCIFRFILVMHSSCSGLHDWYWEPTFASHNHEPWCLFCARVASLPSHGTPLGEHRWLQVGNVFFSWLQVAWLWEINYSGYRGSFSSLWSGQRYRRRKEARASIVMFHSTASMSAIEAEIGQGRQLGSGFGAGSFKSFATLAQLIGFTVLNPPDLQFGKSNRLLWK